MYKLTLCQTYLGRKKRGFSKPVAGRLVKIRAFFTSPLTHGSQSGRRPRVSGSVRGRSGGGSAAWCCSSGRAAAPAVCAEQSLMERCVSDFVLAFLMGPWGCFWVIVPRLPQLGRAVLPSSFSWLNLRVRRLPSQGRWFAVPCPVLGSSKACFPVACPVIWVWVRTAASHR